MNDLASDLGLAKMASEILASRLNKKNLFEKGAKVSYFNPEKLHFNSTLEVTVALYCHNM